MKAILISAAALFISGVNSQAVTFSQTYPTINVIPDVNSPQVKQWVAQINMSSIPNIPVVPAAKDGSPGVPKTDPGSCDWTFNLCTAPTDIVTCPVGYFGLTYDDGPTQFSPALYDALLKTNQKASLFWIGSNVYSNPTVAKRACSDGHHIAVHTWSHHPSTSLSNAQFIAEVKWTETIIKEVCGITPKYFRPPYGDIDNRIRALLKAMGYTAAVIWDIDTNDWQMPPGGTRTAAQIDAQFTQWIADNQKNKTGHICLEHELYQDTVAEAIKQLPNIQANWKAMAVPSCVNDPNPYVEAITFPTIANGMSNSSAAANASSSLPASSAPASTGGNSSSNSSPTGSSSNSSTTTPAAAKSGASLPAAPVAASLLFMMASIFLSL